MSILILSLILTAISPWTWRLFQDGNYLALIKILVLTLILFIGLKKPKIILWSLIFIPLAAPTIFNFKPAELFSLNERRSAYPNTLVGRLFENKLAQYLSHYETNLFYALDPNYYFFGTHPRERPGYSEFSRLSFWLLPFFLYGIYWQINYKKYQLIAYFVITLMIISFFGRDAYSFLLLPFFTITCSLCAKYFLS